MFSRVKGPERGGKGFTLVELLIVVAMIGIISAIAIPAANEYLAATSLRAAAEEIVSLYREAKQKAVAIDKDYALCFTPEQGKVCLVSDKGRDNRWNTADDVVERVFLLHQKGAALSFGHGSRGPVPGHEPSATGITFTIPSINVCVCNPETTGSSGTVYVQSSHGPAMAIMVSSTAAGYKLYKWNGNTWERM